MKKDTQVMNEVISQLNNKKQSNGGKISRTEINNIVDSVCESQNYKGNGFSILYQLGLA